MIKDNARKRFIIRGVMWGCLTFLVFPSVAYAYLDPGTGSYMFQIFLGFLVGLLFTVKTFWRNLKGIVLNIVKKGEKN